MVPAISFCLAQESLDIHEPTGSEMLTTLDPGRQQPLASLWISMR